MGVVYREAVISDAAIILTFIRELADFEKLLHEVVATEDDIRATMFGPNPHTFCFIAEVDGEAAGVAIGFYNYSTFQGKYGLYLEDVYIRDGHRGRGIGKGFFRELARKAVAENCGRLQWSVLDWNTPAIEMYEKLGARALKEWIGYRMEGPSINALAQ